MLISRLLVSAASKCTNRLTTVRNNAPMTGKPRCVARVVESHLMKSLIRVERSSELYIDLIAAAAPVVYRVRRGPSLRPPTRREFGTTLLRDIRPCRRGDRPPDVDP